MDKSRPIAVLLNDESVPAELKKKLEQSLSIRNYASGVLLLPSNDSYLSYADIGRRYVVWNVVATPEFSLEPVKWCYLIVGCLTYKGYFSKDAALQLADKLRAEGYDVHVAGVTAYSTLGWFDDPVINTMLERDIVFLAKVIIHELAHQQIYFSDDTEFNEAFADTVAEYGVRGWLMNEKLTDEAAEFQQSLFREREFDNLVAEYKNKLEKLYHSSREKQILRSKKEKIFLDMKSDYYDLADTWNGHNDYKSWIDAGLNNAKLALVLTYKDLVPEFFNLLEREDYKLETFYRSVSRLESCSREERRRYLENPGNEIGC